MKEPSCLGLILLYLFIIYEGTLVSWVNSTVFVNSLLIVYEGTLVSWVNITVFVNSI